MSAPRTNKKSWTSEEDQLLLQLTEQHGTVGNWPTIALGMEFRTGKQCRERYINQLDPSIKKTEWTVEEDSIIKRTHFEIGKKWSRYMEKLPGRSDNAIKNRYHIISRDNYAEHNLLHAASLSVVIAAPITSEYVPETAAVRLDRFRCAREILDRKIRALEREREELVGQAAVYEEAQNFGSSADINETEFEGCSLGSFSGGGTTDESVGFSPRKIGMYECKFSTELDESHFDTEDMCYNDPHGSYDEVLAFA